MLGKKFQGIVLVLVIGIGVVYQTKWFRSYMASNLNNYPTQPAALDADVPTRTTNPMASSYEASRVKQKQQYPVIDIISVGSLQRPQYHAAQRATFGGHPSVRRFFAITERDDFDPDCNDRLQWRDVQNISGFCGGLRRDIQHKHRLLYELKVKFAKPQWLERTKADPAAWLCAQKRPMAGFWKALNSYRNGTTISEEELPDFLVVMDDDTYYNMEQVADGLVSLRKEQYEQFQDDSMVLAGCTIRSRLKHFKWSFPFGGWGTIFSKSALETLLEPLHCGNATNDSDAFQGSENSNSLSARFCPKLQKDRIGEYQVYEDGMSLASVMHAYVRKEPYADHARWDLGFCLHSDWIWGYMVNYYNVSVALGRRSKDLIVDRLGAYNGSEINPPYSDALLKLRRQCDFDSDQNCTEEAHMCHYITPQHMQHLSSFQQQEQVGG